MIALTTLGTGTVSPHAERTCAAHLVEAQGHLGAGAGAHRPTDAPKVGMLLDCGPGACHRLARSGIAWMELTHVAITHFHPDHYAELPALLFAMKYGAMTPRRAPLTLLGPAGFRERLERLAAAFGDWVLEPGWPLEVVEVPAQAGSWKLEAGSQDPAISDFRPPTPNVVISAHKTPHTPESLAYSISDGERRLVYTGDTGPSDPLGDWAAGCDLLLAECSLPDELALDLHLTPRQAGALAARARARRLVLTHFYPPVEQVDIVAQVREHFAGRVDLAQDGARFEL